MACLPCRCTINALKLSWRRLSWYEITVNTNNNCLRYGLSLLIRPPNVVGVGPMLYTDHIFFYLLFLSHLQSSLNMELNRKLSHVESECHLKTHVETLGISSKFQALSHLFLDVFDDLTATLMANILGTKLDTESGQRCSKIVQSVSYNVQTFRELWYTNSKNKTFSFTHPP